MEPPWDGGTKVYSNGPGNMTKMAATPIWATSWEKLFMPYANNKGADQPAHLRSLISAFTVRCLDSIKPLLVISKLSRLSLTSVAEQAGLSLTWSQTPKTVYIVTRLIYGKKKKKSSSPEPKGTRPWKLVCNIGCSSTTKFIQMMTMSWPWPILRQCQIWSLMLLYWKRVKQWIFQKLL